MEQVCTSVTSDRQLNSLESSFSSNGSVEVEYIEGPDNVTEHADDNDRNRRGCCLQKLFVWFHQRANQCPPVDQLVQKSEIGKLFFSTLVGMLVILASYHSFGLISETVMHDLLLVMSFSMMLLTLALSLQELVPEIAIPAMIFGGASLIVSVHVVILEALPKSKRWPILFVIFPCYILLGSVYLFKICRKDARVKEEVDTVSPETVGA